jgi:hypothetical protein
MSEQEKKNNRICLVLLLLAVIFITLDLSVNIGNIYPDFQMYDGVKASWELQYYTINLHYGASLDVAYQADGLIYVSGIHFTGARVDLFSDYIGYILAFIAMAKMVGVKKLMIKKYPQPLPVPKNASPADKRRIKQRNKMMTEKLVKGRPWMFKLGMITAVMAAVLNIGISVAPFFFNGMQLVMIALVLGIAAFTARMLVIYCFVAGVCNLLRGIQFRQDRRAIYIGWFVAFVCTCVTAITTWVDLGRLTLAYNIITLFAVAFYLYRIFILREYIVGDRPVSMEDVKELLETPSEEAMLMEEDIYASRIHHDGEIGETVPDEVE